LTPNVRSVRARREWVVLGAVAVAAVGVWAVPVSAQLITTTTSTTTTSLDESTTTTEITILPTTTTSDVTTTTEDVTPTSRVATTTTTSSGSVVTLPATTTTSTLVEAPGPVEMPRTTSLPPPTSSDEGLSAGTIVSLLIAGFLLAALLLGLFTWRYWQSTRPTVARHG